MSTMNSFDYASRSLGIGQNAEINTFILDSSLRRAMLTQDANRYQPARSYLKLKNFQNRALNLIAQLIWIPERYLTKTSKVYR